MTLTMKRLETSTSPTGSGPALTYTATITGAASDLNSLFTLAGVTLALPASDVGSAITALAGGDARRTNTPADVSTVTNASAQFATVQVTGQNYSICSSTAAWYRADSNNPTATTAAPSIALVAGTPLIIAGVTGNKIAIIRNAADGQAFVSLAAP